MDNEIQQDTQEQFIVEENEGGETLESFIDEVQERGQETTDNLNTFIDDDNQSSENDYNGFLDT